MNDSTGAAAQQENKKLLGLDHLRALAITMVLFFHYRMFQHPEWIDKTMGFGWSGVDLFFVLSGYLISAQLFSKMAAGKQISFKEFFIKRFFRIIPAYVILVAIYFLIPAFREREAPSPLWKFLTFTQNIGLNIKTQGTFSHAWSLCVEEHFYLLLPIVLIALVYFKLVKKGVVLLLILFAFGFAARLYSWYTFVAPVIDTDQFGVTWYKVMYYPTWNRLDGLLAGVSIAALFQYRAGIKARITKHGNKLLLLGLLLLTGAYFLCLDEYSFGASIFGFPLVALAYGVLVIAAISPSCILYKLKSGATALIAKLSFAIYLSHKGVIHLIQPLLAKTGIAANGNLMFFLCLIAAVLGALILNKIIEAPFLKLRQRILKDKKMPGPKLVYSEQG